MADKTNGNIDEQEWNLLIDISKLVKEHIKKKTGIPHIDGINEFTFTEDKEFYTINIGRAGDDYHCSFKLEIKNVSPSKE